MCVCLSLSVLVCLCVWWMQSISLNQTNFGQTDLAGTPVANRVEQKIAQGDYTCIWTKAKPKEK